MAASVRPEMVFRGHLGWADEAAAIALRLGGSRNATAELFSRGLLGWLRALLIA